FRPAQPGQSGGPAGLADHHHGPGSAEEADHVADDRAAVGDHDPGGHGLLPLGRPAPAGSSNPRLRARVRAWARLWAWSLRKRRLWRFSTVFMAMPRVRAVCFTDSPRS